MVGHQCQIRVSIGSLILVPNWLPELVTKLEIELGGGWHMRRYDGTCGDMVDLVIFCQLKSKSFDFRT